MTKIVRMFWTANSGRVWQNCVYFIDRESRRRFKTARKNFEKPDSSDTNYTSDFFDKESVFVEVTEMFQNPGYKILNGPMEVEFMLQECSFLYSVKFRNRDRKLTGS